MKKLYAGARIRTLRRSLSLTQVEMARRIGVSTSYLNQLENDQRPITATVLMSLSTTFDVDAGYFSPEHDARTVAALTAAFTSVGHPDIPTAEIADLAARYPDLSQALIDIAHNRTLAEHPESPYERVRDYFYEARNHIPALDNAAEKFAAGLGGPQLRLTRIATVLDHNHGVSVRYRRHTHGPRRVFHAENRELHLRTDLSEAQLCFELSLQHCFLAHRELLDQLCAPLRDEQSRTIARLGLAQYYAAAVTMPYGEILQVAEDTSYDIDRIAAHFGTGFETTCHRLSTLQRPGHSGVPFFFVRTDRAGNISKRQSATSFHFSRTGGSCPLWVIHRAFETPGRVTRQVTTMPDGRSYLWVARTVRGTSHGFGIPPKEFAIGLGCDLDQAERLIYARGLDLTPDAATPIGPDCHTCPREHCPQRAFPQVGRPIQLNLDVTSEESYRTAR
ncbi:short-chain fatty acyl-CoA regulator family protein [Corynebacterium spheniscorum]|uniref:HTH cro/C1-type domain-containing protein n=1 Tax=Corynebacterium spheniscorum TaxID=185761 RepID=A0A1I2PS29_9CORY|nr:short-chain fatty acyl-CoA regulator family protein [Corynebacterium spheniscorum]KAA8723421.1 helix-turn-helix domain-containing protein [Corynebacterium spheniscorum]SFG18864.1 hypothetical protein SAMN05660282_00201 [Corynebacterium spheniscorum]